MCPEHPPGPPIPPGPPLGPGLTYLNDLVDADLTDEQKMEEIKKWIK